MVFQVTPNPGEQVDPHTRKPVFVPGPSEDYGNNVPRPQNVSVEAEAPSYFPPSNVTLDYNPPNFFEVDDLNSIPLQEVALDRASRYDFALGGRSPGEDTIYNDLMSGGDNSNRLRESIRERTDLNMKRQQLVQRFISNSRGQVTEKDINELYALDKEEVNQAYANPDTFYERKFAKKATEVRSTEFIADNAENEKPMQEALGAFSNDILAKNQVARKLFEDAQTYAKDRTWGDVAQSLIPFHSWYTMSSAMKSDDGFLLGQKVRTQIENAYRLPLDQFYTEQKKVIDELRATDPALAIQYASSLLGYQSSDAFWDNFLSTMDLTVLTPATIAGLGLGLYGIGKTSARVIINTPKAALANIRMINAVNAMKTMTKNMAGTQIDYVAMLPQARRAQQAAVDSLRAKAGLSGQGADWKAMEGVIQDIINPQRVMTGATNMTAEEAARLEIALLRSSANSLEQLVSRPRSLARLSDAEVSKAMSEAEEYINQLYSSTTLGSRVVRIAGARTHLPASDVLSNTDMIAFHIGTKDLRGYATEAAAKTQAKKLGITKYDVEQIDGGYYIRMVLPVDEKTPTLQGFRDNTDKFADKERWSVLHPVMSRIRMRDSLIPEQLSEDFKTVQAQTNLYFEKNRQQFIDDFDGLSKQQKRDLDNYLGQERDYRVQSGPTSRNDVQRGQYTKTVGELQQKFAKAIGRPPTENEIKAYFSWKNWNDVDYAVRNLDLTRDMSRLGVNTISIRARPVGPIEGPGNWSPNLEGKVLTSADAIFTRKGDASILVWDAVEPRNSIRLRKSFMPEKTSVTTRNLPGVSKKSIPDRTSKTNYGRDYIEDLVNKGGYRVVHLSPYSKATFSDFLKTLDDFAEPPSSGPATSGAPAGKEVYSLQPNEVYGPREPSPLDKYFIDQYGSYAKWREAVEANRTGTVSAETPKLEISKRIPGTNIRIAAGTASDGSHVVYKQFLNDKDKTVAREYLTEEGWKPLSLKNVADTSITKKFPDSKTRKEAMLGFVEKEYFASQKAAKEAAKGVDATPPAAANLNDILEDNTLEEPTRIPGKVRVYHSGSAENTGPRWVSTSRTYGSDYRKDLDFWYKDLDETDPRVNHPDYPTEQGIKQGFDFAFELPEAEAQRMTRINRPSPKQIETSGDYGVGDLVYPLGADGSRLTKNPEKIKMMWEDPKYGVYVQTEGQKGMVPLSQLESVSKVPRKPVETPTQVSPLVPDAEVPTAAPKTPEMPNFRFDYILVRQEEDMKVSALDFIRFPYQEGGHKLDAESYFYLRQPDIYEHRNGGTITNTYEGDINAYSTVLETDGKTFGNYLNTARDMLANSLKSGDFTPAEHFYIKHLDGVSKSFKDFKNQFKEINPNGHLSLKHPFVLTPKNKSTWDYIRPDIKDSRGNLTYPNLENARDGEHNLFHNELNLQFALARSDNLEKVVRKGTSDYPVFGTELQSNLSPMATLINSSSDLIRGRMIDDLKIKSAENFGKAYARVIDAAPELIRRDPMEFILNPKWKKNLQGEDLALLNAAKDYRRALVDFLGVDNQTREFMVHVQRTIGDQIKDKLGQKSHDWVDRHLLRGSHYNPVRWANNMVFDYFFGVFNIKQLAVQAMTAVHSVAVSSNGLWAGLAAHPARWLLYTDDAARMSYIADKVAKAGIMKKEHFIEGVNSYKRSGWHIIGAETALQDDFINQQIKEGIFERSRNAGRVFYKEGDRYTRTTGYLTAYLDWRTANPNVKLTPRIEAQILQRADTLTLNMTAASNSAITQGIGAIPLKFTTYYARFMEQMLPGWTGSKLTPRERLRAYAVYSALFGAPITAGGVVGMWPMYKEWAKAMQENGYDADENMVLKAFNEGTVGLLSDLTGLNQNFSEALGPTGTSWLYDIVNGKSPLFDVVVGVGGTKLEDTFESTWPFFTFVANVFRTDDEKYPLSWSDMENFVRSISSVNNTWRAIEMYNLGVYMSKNKTPLATGVDGTDAAMSLLFGTMPTRLSDAFIKADMVKNTNDMKKAARTNVLKYYRLQMKAIAEGDTDQAVHYGKAIKYLIVANGFTPDEMNGLFSDTTSKAGDFITRAEGEFSKSTPERMRMYHDKIRKRQE